MSILQEGSTVGKKIGVMYSNKNNVLRITCGGRWLKMPKVEPRPDVDKDDSGPVRFMGRMDSCSLADPFVVSGWVTPHNV
jgi:hypothetical protein